MEQVNKKPTFQAMLFAAGLGTRFKPWTDIHPKALAQVNGKSLLERNVKYLLSAGISDIVINVHHFSDQILNAIEDASGWGANIQISNEEDEVLETGGGLLKAMPLFAPDLPILLLNVDILTDMNLEKFMEFHRLQKAMATLAVSDRESSRCFLFDGGGSLTGWRNKGTGAEKWVSESREGGEKAFSGLAILQYEVLNMIERRGKFSLVDVYLDLAGQNSVKAYEPEKCSWVDVGRNESVLVAEKLFV